MLEEKRKRGLNGAHLKWIAIFFMALDHIAAAVLFPILTSGGTVDQGLYTLYLIMRYVGRVSFPMFCFLMIEGFVHTRSRKKYMRNLILFALISEIPFDLALMGSVWDVSHQNVFFTLAIGMATIWLIENLQKRGMATKIGEIFILLIGAGIAQVLATDYGGAGIAVIYVIYVLRQQPVWASAAACMVLTLSNMTEIYSFLCVPAIACYNGERGKQNKYFFYIFYPLHLLLLYIVRGCVLEIL